MPLRVKRLFFPLLIIGGALPLLSMWFLRLLFAQSSKLAIAGCTMGCIVLGLLLVRYVLKKFSVPMSLAQAMLVLLLYACMFASVASPIRRVLRQRVTLPVLAESRVYPWRYDARWMERRTGVNPFSDIDSFIVRGNEGLSALVKNIDTFPGLGCIDFYSDVGDSGLRSIEAINNYPKIRTCNVFSKQITDVGLSALLNWNQLETLNINGCEALTSEGLNKLSSCKSLKTLMLLAEGNDTLDVTDENLREISSLVGIEELYLVGVPVSDDGLDQLHTLSNLRMLVVRRTNVSPAGINRIRRKLPATTIHTDVKPN